jgi:hypothetical protein
MNYRVWIKVLGIVVLSSGWLVSPGLHAATGSSEGYSIEDFTLSTTADLVDVCTIETGHADYTAALAFCYGFMEGVTHYDIAITNLDVIEDIVCIPANVTRTQGVATFIEYMNANPQYGAEPPIDGMFRALVAKWPCED